MTAGEVLALVDALRPNQYTSAQKLGWLRRLDGQILEELLATHRAPHGDLDDSYDGDTVLLAPFPYAEELYTAYLFCQIDLHNAEIQKYGQSLTMLSAAWRQFADFVNRRSRPRGVRGWRR